MLGLIMYLPLSAQGPHGHHGHHAEARLEQMQTELDLSEEQVAQLKALKEERHNEMKALRQSGERPDRETMMAKRAEHQAALEQILNPDQLARMKELRQEKRQEMHQAKQEVRKQMKPILMEQRVKFEEILSASDKARIAELRTEMKALHPEMKAMKMEKREMREECTKPTEAQKAEFKQMRAQRMEIEQAVMEIAQSYESDLKRLHEEIKPQLEELRAEMGQRHGGKGHGRPGMHEKGHRGHGGEGKGEVREAHHQHMLTRFILMDPNGQEAGVAQMEAPQLDIFPNPSQAHNTLHYKVDADGPVKIELISKDGALAKVLFEGKQAAGEYELDVDTQDLNSDVYYYKVTTATGSNSKRFTIAK